MLKVMPDIWFWQLIISPHMAYLAVELAKMGCKVTYVAGQEMTPDRTAQGWSAPSLPGVNVVNTHDSAAVNLLVSKALPDSVHICQGIRANGLVSVAQRKLAARGLRQWVIMETVEDSGWLGWFKRFEYSRLFRSHKSVVRGVLATGHRTAHWVSKRGMPTDRVYPFAYFLPQRLLTMTNIERKPGPFRFVFAGQIISRKRVDWLVEALSELIYEDFELYIVGAGDREPELRELVNKKLGDRVRWMGVLSIPDVPTIMERSDCLVLPSVHDGWGAVISEALMVGTPVICSDACGAAGVVQASGVGGVFSRDCIDDLQEKLYEQLQYGPINEVNRMRLASWAASLGAEAGARYLINIFNYEINGGLRPSPPWSNGSA